MLEFVKVTALYSNAVLTAILPHVSDFAQRAELRTNPITASEVKVFYCDPRKGEVGGHFYLTNGWHFWFAWGHVIGFETPKSYFALQDPDRIPEFFGPVNMTADQALAFGRRIISGLQGTAIERILARPPRITGPFRLADGVVPRYRIEWPRSDVGTNWTGGLGREIDLEIDASDWTIPHLSLGATNFMQREPKVAITPEPLPRKNSAEPPVGMRLPPVNPALSNAFLLAILPAFTDYAKRLELPTPLPITPSMIREGPYTYISQRAGLPQAQIELTNGYLFDFEHGYVKTFALLYDTFYSIAYTNRYQGLIGPINMSAEDVVRLGYKTLHKLGYTEKEIPVLSQRPFVSTDQTAPVMTNGFSRLYLEWPVPTIHYPDATPTIGMEVDLTSKTVKSICIRETNLWREFPKVHVPAEPR